MISARAGITGKMINNYVVITRPTGDERTFSEQLRKINIKFLTYPTIKVKSNTLSEVEMATLKKLPRYDWVIFTSKNGVTYFLKSLVKLKVDLQTLKTKKIAAVGPRTAQELVNHGLKASFIPSQFTTENLARETPLIKGQKLLLPHSDIASVTLTKLLTERGGLVTNIPIYKTLFRSKPSQELLRLLKMQKIACLTFTSPSTIHGFFNGLDQKFNTYLFSIPTFVIGPVTEKTARQVGFKKVLVADTFTTEGMLKKLQKIV